MKTQRRVASNGLCRKSLSGSSHALLSQEGSTIETKSRSCEGGSEAASSQGFEWEPPLARPYRAALPSWLRGA